MTINRRSFIKGAACVAGAAIVPAAAAIEAAPTVLGLEQLLAARVALARNMMAENIAHSVFYSTDEAPRHFTGFRALVDCYDEA